MRKKDYAHLAHLIKSMRQVGETNRKAWAYDKLEQRAYWQGWRHALQHIGYAFADHASVDWDAFTKECGLNS